MHPEGAEDIFVKILNVALAGHLFDDVTEQDITGVVVGELRPGLEFQRLTLCDLNDLLGSALDLGYFVREIRKRRVAWNAGGVSQEVTDRDLLPGSGSVR